MAPTKKHDRVALPESKKRGRHHQDKSLKVQNGKTPEASQSLTSLKSLDLNKFLKSHCSKRRNAVANVLDKNLISLALAHLPSELDMMSCRVKSSSSDTAVNYGESSHDDHVKNEDVIIEPSPDNSSYNDDYER